MQPFPEDTHPPLRRSDYPVAVVWLLVELAWVAALVGLLLRFA